MLFSYILKFLSLESRDRFKENLLALDSPFFEESSDPGARSCSGKEGKTVDGG